MTVIAITQRVAVVAPHGERRDQLDQRWAAFLRAGGLTPLPVSNDRATALGLVAAVDPAGLLLTGGNDPVAAGGDAPERDETEFALIEWARRRAKPILGVCRGLQMLVLAFGGTVGTVAGHVAVRHRIAGDLGNMDVNSYHNLGANTLPPPLQTLARADDGIVEALRHPAEPILGLMWHPEREHPFVQRDLDLVRAHFGLTR